MGPYGSTKAHGRPKKSQTNFRELPPVETYYLMAHCHINTYGAWEQFAGALFSQMSLQKEVGSPCSSRQGELQSKAYKSKAQRKGVLETDLLIFQWKPIFHNVIALASITKWHIKKSSL